MTARIKEGRRSTDLADNLDPIPQNSHILSTYNQPLPFFFKYRYSAEASDQKKKTFFQKFNFPPKFPIKKKKRFIKTFSSPIFNSDHKHHYRISPSVFRPFFISF